MHETHCRRLGGNFHYLPMRSLWWWHSPLCAVHRLVSVLSKQYMATAISMYYMSQQIGAALGISISLGLLKHQFHITLQRIMTEVPEVGPIPHLFHKRKNLTCIRIKLLGESWMILLSWHYCLKKPSHLYARVILPVSGSYQACYFISPSFSYAR